MGVADSMASCPIVPVVLCGGGGTRLWPVSREDCPKPFHGLGWPHSLLQQTVRRFHRPARQDVGPAIVVANEAHRFLAAQQLTELGLPIRHLLLEPQGRGTAPALTLAALSLAAAGQAQALMLMAPADHRIDDEAALWAALGAGAAAAARGAVVLFGVAPERVEPGYGHIHAAAPADDGARRVLGFVEKPPAALAARLSLAGEHFWNSGLCLLRADTWLGALERQRPEILQACQEAMRDARDDGDFVRPSGPAFMSCPSWSMEHAVLEPLASASDGATPLFLHELACGWSDIGAWDAVLAHAERDGQGNAVQGPSVLLDCSGTLVRSAGRLVAAIGLQDVMVVETGDAVLVAHRSAAQQVQAVVQQLRSAGQAQWLSHQRRVQRPWGWFDVIGRGPNWVAKRIVVRPGASLSLQRHRHRAEHWAVVRGVAEVWCDGQQMRLPPYASTFVAQGQVHRLANPGDEELELLELQTGDSVREDDIERLSDDWGRAEAGAGAGG